MFSEEDGDDRIVPTEDVLRIIGPMDDSDSEIIDEFLEPDEEEIDEEEGVDNEDNNEEQKTKRTSFPYYRTTRSMNSCYEMTAYEQFKKLSQDKQKTKLFEEFDDLQHFIIKSESHWKAIDDLEDSDDEDSDEESDPIRKQLLSDWFEGLHKIWEDHYGEKRITAEDLKEKRVRKFPKLSKSPLEIPRLHEKITEDLEANRHNFGIPETKGVSKPIATTDYPHPEVDDRSSTISSQSYSGNRIEHLETKNVPRLENTKKFVSLPKVKKEDTELRFSDDEFNTSTCSVNSAYHEEFNRFFSDLRNNQKVEPFPVLQEKRKEMLKFIVPTSSVRNNLVELSKSTADRRKIPERNAKRQFMQIQWGCSTYETEKHKHQFENSKSVIDKKKRNNIGKRAKQKKPLKIQSSPVIKNRNESIEKIAEYNFRPRKTYIVPI